MKRLPTFSVRRGEKQYVAVCDDLNIITQGRTVKALRKNIEEALEQSEDEIAIESRRNEHTIPFAEVFG